MKMFEITMLFMAALCLSSFLSGKTNNDLTEKKIKGNVKSLSETIFVGVEKFGEFQKQGFKSLEVTLYNIEGKRIVKNTYYPDSSLETNTKYDVKGNWIELNTYNPDGSLKYITTTKYDNNGKWIELNTNNLSSI